MTDRIAQISTDHAQKPLVGTRREGEGAQPALVSAGVASAARTLAARASPLLASMAPKTECDRDSGRNDFSWLCSNSSVML